MIVLLSDSSHEVEIITNQLDFSHIESFSNLSDLLFFFEENISLIRLVLISAQIRELHFLSIIDELNSNFRSIEFIVYADSFNSFDILEAIKKGVYEFVDFQSSFSNLKSSVETILEQSDKPGELNRFSHKKKVNSHFDQLSLLDELLIKNSKTYSMINEVSTQYTQWKKSEFDKFGKPTILIVEDEPDYNDMFYDFLSSDFNVYSVFDGESCLDILNREHFDIILLDLFLPDISGPELVSSFFNNNPDIKVIVVTGFDITKDVIDVMKAGAYDLLHKPVLKSDLMESIHSAWTDIITHRVILLSEQDFYRDFLSDSQKVLILKALFLYYQEKNQHLKMFDIYIFYPELRKINIPDSFLLPEHISYNTIGSFIDSIKAVDILI